MKPIREQAGIKALRYLSYGPRSRRCLYEKLVSLGFSAEVSTETVDEMEVKGFINDEKMAAGYVAYAVESKAYGKHRVLRELECRKIDREIAENAYRAYISEREEQGWDDGGVDIDLENAVNSLLKRMRQTGLSAEELDNGDIRRLTGFLHRRGFSFDVIRRAFERVREEEG